MVYGALVREILAVHEIGMTMSQSHFLIAVCGFFVGACVALGGVSVCTGHRTVLVRCRLRYIVYSLVYDVLLIQALKSYLNA